MQSTTHTPVHLGPAILIHFSWSFVTLPLGTVYFIPICIIREWWEATFGQIELIPRVSIKILKLSCHCTEKIIVNDTNGDYLRLQNYSSCDINSYQAIRKPMKRCILVSFLSEISSSSYLLCLNWQLPTHTKWTSSVGYFQNPCGTQTTCREANHQKGSTAVNQPLVVELIVNG